MMSHAATRTGIQGEGQIKPAPGRGNGGKVADREAFPETPGGQLVLVEFHPVVWMSDERFREIKYPYFNQGPICESNTGTYADKTAAIEVQDVGWNHPLSEVLGSLIAHGLTIRHFQEYDNSPYDCFETVTKVAERKYRIPHLGDKIPMLYSVVAD
jgi:hypothetical protein